MNNRLLAWLTLIMGGPALLATDASAQPLGVYRFQLQPYCNVLTLNVIQQSGVFTLQGFDDQCGASGPTAVVGSGLGTDDTTIGYTDINGINLRAVQALEARTRELEDLKARLAALVSDLLEMKQ